MTNSCATRVARCFHRQIDKSPTGPYAGRNSPSAGSNELLETTSPRHFAIPELLTSKRSPGFWLSAT